MRPSTRVRLRQAVLPVSILVLFACAKTQVKIHPEKLSPIEAPARTSSVPSLTKPSPIDSPQVTPSIDSPQVKPPIDSPQGKPLINSPPVKPSVEPLKPSTESPRSKSPVKTYSELVSQWKSDLDLIRWMEKEFYFDADRFKKFEQTLPPPRTPEETFRLKSGIYIDAALFAKETLNRIDPSYKAKIGILIIRPYGVNHYFCSFGKGGKIFIMDYGTPYKETTGTRGPYHSLAEVKKFYERHLPIKGHVETISYLP